MTLGLSMITNKAQAAMEFWVKYHQYFDEAYITVADKDKKQYDELVSRMAKNNQGDVHISYFKWCDDFAKARNRNLTKINTDYWFWADDDDTIENPERLQELVKFMAQNDLDVLQLKYDYAQNTQGQAVSDHWRERLIRTKYEGHWDAPVHETFQGPPAKAERVDGVIVKHKKSDEDMGKSMLRNEKILRKHFEKTHDPRDAYYLGMTDLAARNYKDSIQWFLQHIKTAGSDEDKYRSWCRIADAEWCLGNNDQSLYATDEAIRLRPNFPDAYYIKIMNYAKVEDYDKGIEWLKVALAKPVPDTLHMIDPTLYQYRGMAMGGICYLFSGRVKEAFQIYKAVTKEAPDFYEKEKELDGVDWPKLYEEAYFDQKAIDSVKWLLQYTKGENGKPLKIFESLPARILNDVRLTQERTNFLPVKKWPEKSIVFYCGPANEQWGPDTLDKGMGGSEEAIVYLSRELAHLGWEVTVYNDRDEEYIDGNYEASGQPHGWAITYKPWQLFNPSDTFDVFVAWRNPSFTRAVPIKARKKVVDMHDVPTITNADIEKNDLFFFKTNYHASLAKVPKEKYTVIGNGIVKEQF